MYAVCLVIGIVVGLIGAYLFTLLQLHRAGVLIVLLLVACSQYPTEPRKVCRESKAILVTRPPFTGRAPVVAPMCVRWQ